MYLLPYLWCFV